MHQRPGKKKAMALFDHDDKISLFSLVKFCDEAAALRFEIFKEYLTHDFRGGYLKYEHKALGL